jgi:hypothetical protein
MPNDSKAPDPDKTWEELLLATMTMWADSLASIQHTLSSVTSYLGVITDHEKQEAKDLDEAKKSVSAIQDLLAKTQETCQKSLCTFTKFQGPMGKIQWFLQELNERPKGIYRLVAVTGFTAVILAFLGLDVSQLLKAALAGLIG